MAQLPSLARLSMIGMNAASGSGSGDDGGGWRPKRKWTASQESERKQRQKAEADSSDEWKEFRNTFAHEINKLRSMEAKVGMRFEAEPVDPIDYLNAQMDVFHRMVRWFVDDSHEDFLLTTLQRNDKLLNNFRGIVQPFEKLCARVGYQYGKGREMVHTHLMLGILQIPSSRGGHHQERASAKLRELKTYIILEDKKNAASAVPSVARAPAPAPAPAPAAAGPSVPVSGVTPEFQHKLDDFDGQLEQIDKSIERIKATNPNPELPELVKAVKFRELIQAERDLLIAKQNHARAKDALKNPPTLTLQLIQDEQKADGHVLDLELKISDLKYELGV